jgi:hypothetical protein
VNSHTPGTVTRQRPSVLPRGYKRQREATPVGGTQESRREGNIYGPGEEAIGILAQHE